MAVALSHHPLAPSRTLPRVTAPADLRMVSQGWVQAPWAVEVGDLIALPILETADGLTVDLEAMADNRAAVLVFDPALASDMSRSTLATYADAQGLVDAAGAALIVITPDDPWLVADAVRDAGVPLAVDAGHRFAHTLGLVTAPCLGEGLTGAIYVVSEAGTVLWTQTTSGAEAQSKASTLLRAVMALKTDTPRRIDKTHA